MKLFTLLALLLVGLYGSAQTQFWSDDFEDAGSPSSGSRTPSLAEFYCTGTAYFTRTTGSSPAINPVYTGFTNSKFFSGADIDRGPTCTNLSISAGQSITWSGINITGKSGLSFKGKFGANSTGVYQGLPFLPNMDSMAVEYRINGGAWTKIVGIYCNDNTVAGGSMGLDLDGNRIGDGGANTLGNALSEFSANIAGTGTTLDLRFDIYINNGSPGSFAFDDFRLFETAPCTAPTITAQPPTNSDVCTGGTKTIACTATGATAYQWQVDVSGTGSGPWTDLTNTGFYSNVTTNTLTITGANNTIHGYDYRCKVMNGLTTCFTNTNSSNLRVSTINLSTYAQSNVSCFNGSNGTAVVIPSGGINGTAPGAYTYSWSPSGGTNQTATGLVANPYTVTVTDATLPGCTATRNFTITQPATAVSGSYTTTNVACNGGTSGAINLTPAGGTPGYFVNWGGGVFTEDRSGLAAGAYNVIIEDANGCQASYGITVTQPTALNGTTVVTNVTCNGGTSGAIDLTPSGGTPGYTYNWGGGVTSQDRASISAGAYSVTITDANSCTKVVNVTVTQPTAVSGTTVVTNVACFGGNTGAINLTPTGGTGPYTFNWGGGVTSEDRTTLTAGSYSVTITDANACTGTVNVTVTQPAAPVSGTTVVTNVACFGGNTGAINLTPTGGVGPYTFNWVGGATTEDRTTLTAGTYSVTITDVNGCTGTVNATVTQPASVVSGTTVVTNVACFGGNTGAINLTPTGGVGPYTFNWVGGATTEDRTTLTAGSYSVTITDANGCTGTVSPITVTQPASAISGTTVVTNVACFGGNTGAINLTPTGGVGPYTFNWVSGPTTEDRTGLTAGTYSVTITDANGCTGTVSPTVTQPAAAVSGTTVVTNVACFGGNTGAINLTPTGGVGPYTFDWGGGITSEDRTTLIAGTYSVTITDANSCTGTVNATVTQPAAVVSGTTVVTNVACFGGNTGAINLTPTGGVGPYTFNWVSGPTTEDRTGLTAGTYSVTITDANSCTGTVSGITVTQPATAVSGTTVVTNVACFGGNTGAINLTPTGGVGPYTFNWTAGPTTEDRTGLVQGTYSVTITDANGCTGTVNATVTQPSFPVTGMTIVTNVACFGGNTGVINLTPTGGTSPYTFDWGGGITSEDRTTLIAGTYSVTITDANSCTGIVNATVTQPASALSGTTVVTNVACFGGNTGAINLTPTGGVGPYTFDWVSGPTTEDRTGLTAGTYSVTITDDNGCTATVNATVTQPASAVSGTTVVTDVSCFNGSNGTINLTPIGGVGPYTFNWVAGPTTEDRTGLTAGSYSVTITDANGCTATVNPTVTQPTALVVSPVSQTNIACNSGANGAASVSVSGGTPGYTYSWSPTGGTAATANGLIAGTYTVTVTDANGCTATQSFTITEPTAISFTAAAQTNVACFGGSTGAFAVNPATGGTGAFTYDWTPGTPTGDGTTSVTGLTAGSYSVTATDANGCSATISFTITEPPVLAITGASQTEVSCNGGANGTATVTATGGTPGYTYSWSPSGGTAATATGLEAGTYVATVTDANGCSVTQTFVLNEPTAIDLSVSSQVDVLCNGAATGSATVTPSGGTGAYTYSWSPSGGTAATATGLEAGTYIVTVTDDNNCQDTKTFTITEAALITSSFSHAACNSYTWGTQTHSTSGVYTQTFTAANGCDSIVTLTLSIVSEVTNTVTESSCNSYTWAQNGMTYTVSGMYVDTIQAVGGCDSIVTLDLTINTPSSSSSSEFACGTYTWALNGMTYTASGVYMDTIPNAAGCDSIITLNLTIGGTSTLQPASACGSYTWAANGVTYTTSGMYYDSLVDINGCDSILILDLTINPSITATATDNGNGTFTASAGSSYQWINCTTSAPVSGATAQTFVPAANGTYAVIVTNASGCSDTSNCIVINNVGLNELESASVQVFPNPTENFVTISMSFNQAKLIITDAQGKTLYTGEITNGEQVNLASYEDGVYFLSVETESGKVLKRIVKN